MKIPDKYSDVVELLLLGVGLMGAVGVVIVILIFAYSVGYEWDYNIKHKSYVRGEVIEMVKPECLMGIEK